MPLWDGNNKIKIKFSVEWSCLLDVSNSAAFSHVVIFEFELLQIRILSWLESKVTKCEIFILYKSVGQSDP